MKKKQYSPYTLIESGHYYSSIGPTKYSLDTQIKAKEIHVLMGNSTKSIQFIDDVHFESSYEQNVDVLEGNELEMFQGCNYDYRILESETIPYAFKIIDALKKSPYTSHELKIIEKDLYFKGVKLLHKGVPTCTLMDAGLTVIKQSELGFLSMKNVLHSVYAPQQENLKVLIHAIKKTGILHEKLILQSILI